VTCLGFGGLFAYRGSLAWTAVALYAGTVAWACSSRPPHPEPSAGGVDSVEEPPVITADAIRSMAGAELCQAWRRSSMMLSAAHDPGQRVQVVALRQVILDSMDVRDPAGLREWLLHSGVRAAGDPDRFFIRDGSTAPRRRWDAIWTHGGRSRRRAQTGR
jgi:hypothetical protein